MIGDFLEVISKETSKYLDAHLKMPTGKKSVVLHNPNSGSGEFELPDNSICMSLLNIEEELSIKNAMIQKKVIDGKIFKQNPAINLNIYVIFIANFKKDYVIELNSINKIIEFFHEKPVFSAGNTVGLKDLKLEEVKFTLNTLPMEKQHDIWNLLGGKYLPSVLYKVGMITVQEELKPLTESIVQSVELKAKQK